MLDAVERALDRLASADAAGGGAVPIFVWVDVFCASQNLLAGVYRDPTITRADGEAYRARKEDTDRIFDDALEAIRVVIFYLAPLAGKWRAPPHPYLADDRGEPRSNWMRHGPVAATRAWCLFELSTALAAHKELLVELAPSDRKALHATLQNGANELDATLAAIDAAEAQISKVEDRALILPRVQAVGGFGSINARVKGALRDWLAETGRALLRDAEVGTTGALLLQNGLAQLLQSQGKYEEAEPLFRRTLAAREAALGPAHPHTLTLVNNLALLLKAQGKYEEAEPLYRRALAGREEALGPAHPDTLASVNNLAQLLQALGKYEEAEPLYRRALAGREEALGPAHPNTLTSVGNLAVLLQSLGKHEQAAALHETLRQRRQDVR